MLSKRSIKKRLSVRGIQTLKLFQKYARSRAKKVGERLGGMAMIDSGMETLPKKTKPIVMKSMLNRRLAEILFK